MSGKSTYLDLLAPCLAESDIRTTFHSRESLGAYLSLEEAEKKDVLAELSAYAEDRNEELEEYVDQVLSYRYEHKKALKVRSKFSVSELNGKGKKNLTLEQPIFAAGKTVLTGAEKGNHHPYGNGAFGLSRGLCTIVVVRRRMWVLCFSICKLVG